VPVAVIEGLYSTDVRVGGVPPVSWIVSAASFLMPMACAGGFLRAGRRRAVGCWLAGTPRCGPLGDGWCVFAGRVVGALRVGGGSAGVV